MMGHNDLYAIKMSVDRESKLNRYAYSALVVMKHSFTNQNFHKTYIFPWVHFFWKRFIYVNKGTLRIFDIFYHVNYLIGPNILQLVFDLITYSKVA